MSSSSDAVTTGQKNASTKATIHYPFWFGGSASCFAACVTHPLDLVKVRLQTQSVAGPQRNMLQMFVHVVQSSGPLGLYSGLSAALLRQITYSTTRFGIYEELKERVTTPTQRPSFPALIGMAATSGFIGGMAGTPADVLNVRMQHDAALAPADRRNYKHAIDGLVRMVREEGRGSIWRGIWPNSTRAMMMTASQLASYDQFKVLLRSHLGMGDTISTHFTASVLAGLVATTICSPVDVIKTRVMSSSENKSLVKLLGDIYKAEGLGWMFRGWVPSFIRLGPHTIATFLFLEEHKKLYRKLKGLPEPDV